MLDAMARLQTRCLNRPKLRCGLILLGRLIEMVSGPRARRVPGLPISTACDSTRSVSASCAGRSGPLVDLATDMPFWGHLGYSCAVSLREIE